MTDEPIEATAHEEGIDEAKPEEEARLPVRQIAPEDIPIGAEIRAMAQLAVTFAGAQLVPKPLQNRPADVLLVLMTGRDLGITPTTALRECHPIDGKVTVSPKLKQAIVHERGLGRTWPRKGNDAQEATWYGRRKEDPPPPEGIVFGSPQDPFLYESRFSWEDAQRAGMVQSGCQPNEHTERCRKAGGKQNEGGCKDNWRRYPARMLSWRALGYLIDDCFSEVGTGLYSADEMGVITDDNGQPVIDVTEVGELDGMRRQQASPGGQDEPIVGSDIRDALIVRIAGLPDAAKVMLKAEWIERVPRPLATLRARDVKIAEPLVAHYEARAVNGEWGPPETPQEPAGAADGQTDPGPDPVAEAHTEAPGTPAPADPIHDTVRWVADMTMIEVDQLLFEHGLPPAGNAPTRRQRLAEFLLNRDRNPAS